MESNPQSLLKPLKTYKKVTKPKVPSQTKKLIPLRIKREPLTTKKAVELLVNGKLKHEVCRYCLNITYPLSELDQVLHIGGGGAMYGVTIRCIVASFHPIQVLSDPNFPDKICEKCLDKAVSAYLFAQQCEQAERALRNCFDDMYEKLEKLDHLDRTHKRGRQKLKPNYNTLLAEHQNVMDYATPIRSLINIDSVTLTNEPEMSDLECKKCWELLPNLESLIDHEKKHPKSMWYSCRLCGRSFVKAFHLRRHLKTIHSPKRTRLAKMNANTNFECKACEHVCDDYQIHLQHIEKHRFQRALEHLVERKTNLCAVCLGTGGRVDMDKIVCLHGGYPEITGDKTLYHIMGATLPEMNILQNYTGTKICDKCLDSAIAAYVFINRTHCIRERLNLCIDLMLKNLEKYEIPETKLNIFIEISKDMVMPIKEDDYHDSYLIDQNEDFYDEDLKMEVLEDEFRLKSESESDDEPKLRQDDNMKTYSNKKLNSVKIVNQIEMNGYTPIQTDMSQVVDACSEFLTFKKKKKPKVYYKTKYTCPICNKKFISDYFLKKHVLKHILRKSQCKTCGLQLESKFSLYEHKKMVHINKSVLYFKCATCGRQFNNRNKYFKHSRCHNLKQCDFCNKTFKSQMFYNNHMQRHASKLKTNNRSLTCSFCEKQCINDNILTLHVNKIHLQIKPYNCDMCDRQFYTETNLRCHKKCHSIFSKETCEFCSKVFRCRKDLVGHVRKHMNCKPYHCQLCGQDFYMELKLFRHMRVFHGGRFCCNLCKAVFRSKKELKVHVGSHNEFL